MVFVIILWFMIERLVEYDKLLNANENKICNEGLLFSLFLLESTGFHMFL